MTESPKTVHLRYHALLRDHAGRESETVATRARTAAELYEELRRCGRMRVPHSKLKVAINDEFQNWDAAIRDGDRVSLLPPVAGG